MPKNQNEIHGKNNNNKKITDYFHKHEGDSFFLDPTSENKESSYLRSIKEALPVSQMRY